LFKKRQNTTDVNCTIFSNVSSVLLWLDLVLEEESILW
jgi:hypothetical protein